MFWFLFLFADNCRLVCDNAAAFLCLLATFFTTQNHPATQYYNRFRREQVYKRIMETWKRNQHASVLPFCSPFRFAFRVLQQCWDAPYHLGSLTIINFNCNQKCLLTFFSAVPFRISFSTCFMQFYVNLLCSSINLIARTQFFFFYLSRLHCVHCEMV